jgi:hypothetical protein
MSWETPFRYGLSEAPLAFAEKLTNSVSVLNDHYSMRVSLLWGFTIVCGQRHSVASSNLDEGGRFGLAEGLRANEEGCDYLVQTWMPHVSRTPDSRSRSHASIPVEKLPKGPMPG